jgi:hypothetical protein
MVVVCCVFVDLFVIFNFLRGGLCDCNFNLIYMCGCYNWEALDIFMYFQSSSDFLFVM